MRARTIFCINDFEIAFGADVRSACPPNVLFFKEPVGALDGVIELAWVDVEVGNGVEVAVGDIHGAIGLLRDDGVAADDEAVVEVGTHHVPAAWLAVGEQMAHAVVADGVGDA